MARRRRPTPDPDRVLLKLYVGLFLGFGGALLLDTFVLAVATIEQRLAAAVFLFCAFSLWVLAALWAQRRW
jgi:hypothetical protein